MSEADWRACAFCGRKFHSGDIKLHIYVKHNHEMGLVTQAVQAELQEEHKLQEEIDQAAADLKKWLDDGT